jgi:hypothetical protein
MYAGKAIYCAVLFRLFKKTRGHRAAHAKSIGFCAFAAAGTGVASRGKNKLLAGQNDRFAAVVPHAGLRSATVDGAARRPST